MPRGFYVNTKLVFFCEIGKENVGFLEFFTAIGPFWAFASDVSELASEPQMPTDIDFTMIFGGIGGKKSGKTIRCSHP